MKARRAIRLAFFALGWLIALGILFQHAALARFSGALRAPVQRASSRWRNRFPTPKATRVRTCSRTSRSEYLSRVSATLDVGCGAAQSAANAVRRVRRRFPNTFAGSRSSRAHVQYQFPIISFYSAWGDKPDESEFPLRMVETIDRMGSVPMITWEPWVDDFDEELRTNLPAPSGA